MNTVIAIMGSLGGLAVFLGAVFTVARNIIRQSNSVDANSKALDELKRALQANTGEMGDLKHSVHELDGTVNTLNVRMGVQSDRISRLEGVIRNNGTH